MIVATDHCPCVGCTAIPRRGGVLCSWHEALLPSTAHRRYLACLWLFQGQTTTINLARSAAMLARLCGGLALKDGKLTSRQLDRLYERYASLPLNPTTMRKGVKS
jgi:hypothetical protein